MWITENYIYLILYNFIISTRERLSDHQGLRVEKRLLYPGYANPREVKLTPRDSNFL